MSLLIDSKENAILVVTDDDDSEDLNAEEFRRISQEDSWVDMIKWNYEQMVRFFHLEILGNTRIALLLGPASLLNACVPSSAHIADYGHIRAGTAVRAVVIGSCLAVGS